MSFDHRASGTGLNPDQLADLAALEQQQTLTGDDRGRLAAMRMFGANEAQKGRIDRCRAKPSRDETQQPTSLGTDQGRDGYLEHLGQAMSSGACPTCGQQRPVA